jgi:EAL and modified HD-GYP domain-containing signal transduction protein
MPKVNVDTRDTLYVARQPILEADGQVYGYELLYRADGEDLDGMPSKDLAAARVLSDAVLNVGLDTLTGGRPAFINLSRSLLLGEVARLLAPTMVVFELHDLLAIDEPVMETCRHLSEEGYALALGDFVPGCDAEVLLPYAKFVKVDVLTTPAPMQRELLKYLAPSGVKLVAEHVETADLFEATKAAGYALFQGHYFCLPKMCSAAAVRSRHVAYMQLLAALNRPGLSLTEVEDLIKHDVSLSYRVLRCINSAAFGVRREIHSIREALLLMGLAPIKSWASVWCMAGLNTGGTSELVTVALVRARCCELLGEHLESEEAPELFLIGLCSLLDAMLGKPLEDAVADLPLSPGARDAVLGMRRSPARSVLNAVIAYERGAWELSADELKLAGLPENMVAEAYTGALSWARELTQANA